MFRPVVFLKGGVLLTFLYTVFLKFNVELIQFELIHELIQKKDESESNRFIFEKGESEFLIDSNFLK